MVASPSEVKQVVAMGVRTVGLYRTELPVIQRQGRPREASLTVPLLRPVELLEDARGALLAAPRALRKRGALGVRLREPRLAARR